LAFALALAASNLASAAMDLSDGLSTDLPRLCAASGVGARVVASAVPLHDVLLGRADAWAHAVDGGDDYALLFTAPPTHHDQVLAVGARTTTRPRVIGSVTAEPGVEVLGARWPGSAFRHFAGA
jgi:thiamine-monophosphate kinase